MKIFVTGGCGFIGSNFVIQSLKKLKIAKYLTMTS